MWIQMELPNALQAGCKVQKLTKKYGNENFTFFFHHLLPKNMLISKQLYLRHFRSEMTSSSADSFPRSTITSLVAEDARW